VITERLPSDWRDLQRMVAMVLKECGFGVEIERPTRTVRGTTEICRRRLETDPLSTVEN
jgi:hypothetical protein